MSLDAENEIVHFLHTAHEGKKIHVVTEVSEMKIMVIGSSGSGKSTFSRELGKRIGFARTSLGPVLLEAWLG